MKSLISFLALIWLAMGDPTRTAKDGYLDPGKIRWWKDTWAPNPIELSQTNSGTSGVTVNINFRPQTSLPTTGNMGIVIVTVPSAFSSTTSYPSDSMAIKANTDTSFSFTLGTALPTAGVYGPFQIVTKTMTGGQIYDANYVFGCVAVSASISSASANSLTVATVSLTSTTAYVSSSDGLTFTFTIPAGTNLWKHDIFEIVPDTHWTIPTSPSCSSVDISGTTNNIKGPKGDNSLPCAIAASGLANGGYSTAKSTATPAKNSIYIYGLSQDVLITSSYQIKLQVSSFTLPSSAVSTSNFSWNLKIWRWGTTNLLAQYAGTGPLTPVAGAVTISSWVPYNTNIASTDIPNSSSNSFYVFTKLTFSAAHAITYGTIVITFNSNADISSGYWWQDHADTSDDTRANCYLNTYVKGITCGVSSTKATITIADKVTLAANTAISITLLTKLTSGAGISSIITTDTTTSANIDQITTTTSWSFNTAASTYVPMTSFQFFATAANEIPTDGTLTTGEQIGGNLATQYLMWYMTPKNDWSATTTLKVGLPINSSGVQLLTSYITSAATYKEIILASGDYASSAVALGSAINTPTLTAGTPGSISIAFVATGFPTTGGKPMFAFSYGDNSGATHQVSLPFVASNVATFYECWAKTSSTTNGAVTEFSNYVFSVITSQVDSGLKVASLCKDNYAGIPIAVVFHSLNIKFNFGDTSNLYYLDVEFSSLGTSNLGTGATGKETIPVASAATGATATINPTSSTVTISGLGSVDADATVTVYLPYGGDISTSYTTTQTFYYLVAGADPANKMVLYSGTGGSSFTASGSLVKFSSGSFTAPASGTYTIGGTSVSTTLSVTPDSTGVAADVTAGWIGVALPAGFTTSSTKLVLNSNNADLYKVASSSSSFTGGFLIAPLSATTKVTHGAANTLSMDSGLTVSPSTGSSGAGSGTLTVFISGSTIGSSCKCASQASALTATINPATITSDTCTLDKLYAQGSDSVDSTLTLSFTTVNPIPAGGSIIITLASSTWTFPSSSPLVSKCEGVGFTDQSKDENLLVTCTISGTTVTLSQFSQIAAGQVNVKLYHVIPTSATAGSPGCFTAVKTYDASSYVIDSATGLTNSVTVVVSTAAGTTNASYFTAKLYPNVAGATADVYLTFSLSKSVPQYGIISITPGFVSSLSLSSGDVSGSCWTDQDYYGCTVSGTVISIQLSNALQANTAMKVYLDMALVLPTTNSTAAGWTISSSWNGVSITADSTSASPATFQQVIGTAVSNTITLSSILAVNSQTADETTSYIFTFSSGVVVATSDTFVIEFPKDFSPLLGLASAVFPDCLPNNYYTTCSSTALGISSGTYCSVDHWKLTVTGITKATTAAAASIDITVDGIQNPVAGTTDKFSFYQYGSDGSVKAYTQKTGSVTTVSLPSTMVSLKDATVDTTTLSKSATYTFDFYLSSSTTFTTDNIISIYFPSQFNNKLRNGSTVPCKSVYYDESSSSTSTTTSNTLSSATSCLVSGSNVTLTFPSSLTTATATTSRIQLQLTGFYNPESAISRTIGWDVSDYSTFSSSKLDQYSNKFTIAINQNSKNQIYAESWSNLNSASIGYTVGYGSSYSTSTSTSSSKVSVLPGTQSTDQTISILDSNSWPMKSKSYKLSPTPNSNYPDSGNIKYTSAFHSYTIFQMTSQFNFRVAATSSAASGIYYIDWGTPTEKLQDGISNPLYVAPLSTMIEVCSSLSAATVTVDTLPTLYQYYTSIPIKVSLVNAPATQLIVTPTFSVAGFTVTPTSLTFSADVNTLYFQVNVGSAYSASTTSPTISFTLGGTDAASFAAPNKQTVTVSSSYPSIVAATPGLSATKVSASEVKVTVTSSIAGVLYWGFGCQGSPVLDFAGLYSLVSDLVTPSKTIQSLQEQLSEQYLKTETDIDTTKDADINAFFKRMKAEHCNDYWASSQVITTAGATIDFNWLMAGTTYTFSAYIATRLTNDTAAYPLNTYNFTTDAPAQYYSTAVTFSGSVPSTSSGSIAKILAKNMGVNPSWLTYVSSTSRMLQSSTGTTSTTTFTYNVLSDNRYPAYTSSNMISILNTNQAQASSDFTSTLALTSTALGTSTAISTGTTPAWSTAPAKTANTDTSATFTAASTLAGTIYVSCTDNDLTARTTYGWQVSQGLDATTEIVPSASVTAVATTSETLTVTGLSAGTTYACYFTACNSYPVTPSCIEYTSTTPLQSIKFKTSGSSGDDSSAAMMGASALLAFILTLLN